MAEREHHQQRRHLRRVAEVVSQLAFGEGRTGCGFDGDNPVFFLFRDFLVKVWKRQPGEIAAAAAAGDDGIRLLAREFHLFDGFLADDRLVQADVVQHAAQGIFRVRMRGGVLDGLADGDAEAAGTIRIFRQQFAPVIRSGRSDSDAPSRPRCA